MANQPNPTAVASRQGQFLGSTGIAFANQTASDIFFDEYWTTEGHIARMAVICTSWGISMLYFMTGYRDGLWIPANELLATVDVEDHGVLPPEGDELVAPDVLAVQAGAQAIHWINGEAADMHYHKPKKRTGHVAYVAPEPKPGGKHIIFNKLTFGTQVSNYRRVQRL